MLLTALSPCFSVAFLILFVLLCCRHSFDFELSAVGFRGRDGIFDGLLGRDGNELHLLAGMAVGLATIRGRSEMR